MYYAQIDKTTRVCVAATETHSAIDDPCMIETDGLRADLLGKVHDKGTGAWADAPPPAPSRILTRLAFLNRFTDAEAIAIDLASIGATAKAAAMRRYTAKVNAATFIDLDRQDTRAGVQALEAAGLLAEGRAAAILDSPIDPSERYRG